MTSDTQVDPTVEPADDKTERSNKLRQAYSAATTRLREEHRDEFDTLYSQEAQDRGVDYTPRLSPEQKAAQEMAELLEKFPSLREQFTPDDDTTDDGGPVVPDNPQDHAPGQG